MAIESFEEFAAGDLDYIGKHNTNWTRAEGLFNTILDRTSTTTGTATPTAGDALFGEAVAFIGEDSYAAELDADPSILTVGPGYAYKFAGHQVVSTDATTTMDFAGQASGTYYIRARPLGIPDFSLTNEDSLWSVSWNGTALSSLTRLARTVWGAEDWIAAQESTYFDASYRKLADRLDAIEANFLWAPTIQPASGVPDADAVVFRALALHPVELSLNFSGAIFRLTDAPADGDLVLVVKTRTSGGTVTTVGSMTFADGTTATPTLDSDGSAVSIAAGTELQVVWPNPSDSAAAGLYGGFVGRRGV